MSRRCRRSQRDALRRQRSTVSLALGMLVVLLGLPVAQAEPDVDDSAKGTSPSVDSEVGRVDPRRLAREIGLERSDSGMIRVYLEITYREGLFVQPHIALGFILGRPMDLRYGTRIDRERLVMREAEALATN